MSRALRDALRRLLEADSARLPASQLTRAQRAALDEFQRHTGAVQVRRRGRGIVYAITDRGIVEQHHGRLAPLPEAASDPGLPRRAANIGRAGSSKRGRHGHDRYYLLLRARGAVQWRDDDGYRLDLGEATRRQGAGALAIGDPDAGWHSASPLWLVENQALFDRLDWLPGDGPASVAWYGGQLNGRLVEWLAGAPRAPQIHLFPDYDGVGLSNYERLRSRLGGRIGFWLMPDWEQRLRRFGRNDLWRDTSGDFHAALARLQPVLDQEPGLRRLVEAMQALGRALEQEAVWL